MIEITNRKYLRVSEVDQQFGIKPGVLYQLINAGKIRTVRIGAKESASKGTRLIDLASLEQYLASRATGGAA